MNSKYVALWIPTGEDAKLGSICIDPFGNPFRLMEHNSGMAFMDDGILYPYPDSRFQPGKLYLCDRDLQVGQQCYNPRTTECFRVPDKTYITGTNHNDDDFHVIGEIDPNLILRNFTPLEEENVEGFMWGGGDDQLGYFVLRAVPEEMHIALPKLSEAAHIAFKPSVRERRVQLDRNRLIHIRQQASTVFELTKGFTPEQMSGASNEFKTMQEMAGYVLELTSDL